MSVLTFLLFSSIVYFAIADPIATSKDQENIDAFMAAVEKAYDAHISPLMASQDKQDQAYFKSTTINGIGGVLNYSLYNVQSKKGDSKTLDDEDIILLFDSRDTFASAPYQATPPLCTQP